MRTTQDTNHFYFAGFDTPNYTSVPDELFDVLAPELSEAELRVLLYIVRRTFGFKKDHDAISVSQMVNGITNRAGVRLDHGTGLSRRGVINGCNGLVEKGVITVDKRRTAQGDSDVNVYRLRFRSGGGVVHALHGGSAPDTPPVVQEVHPQETASQDTEQQETEFSISSKSARARSAGAHHTQRSVASQASANPTGRDGAGAERNTRTSARQTPEPVAPPLGRQGMTMVGDVLRRRLPQRPPGAHKRPIAGRFPSATHVTPSRHQTARMSRSPRAERAVRVPRRQRRRVEAPPYLAATLAEVSRQLNDAHPASSLTRAIRLWQSSGLAEDAFVSTLYGARSITRQQPHVRRAMPYFFSVVEDLVGTKEMGDKGAAP